MVLPDWSIKELVEQHKIIEPFVDRKVSEEREGIALPSYGLEPHGYTFRIYPYEFYLAVPPTQGGLEQEAQMEKITFNEGEAPLSVLLPPQTLLVGRSLEYFRVPHDAIGLLVGKSSYTRRGVFFNGTVLDAGWEGYITFSLYNAAPFANEVYLGYGIGQVIFLVGAPAEEVYHGLYQQAHKIILPPAGMKIKK